MAQPQTMPFVMHGSREAIAIGLVHIEQQVDAIEHAVASNAGLAFDLARTLVESVCRRILSDRLIQHAPADDLTKLYKAVSRALPFLPAEASNQGKVRQSLLQTLNGLSTTLQGVCALRNSCGFASHGSDAPRPALESVQALLAASAADAIVGFLYRVHIQDGESAGPTDMDEVAYDDNPDFNDWVDDDHDVIRILNEEFVPSRVLFELAPEPYRVYLADFDASATDDDSGDADDDDSSEVEHPDNGAKQ